MINFISNKRYEEELMKLSYSDTRNRLKSLLVATPLLGPAARSLARIPMVVSLRALRRRLTFPGSSNYWEQRYRQGGNSGAGSYGRLAEFKADILNDFVAKMSIPSVIEYGCGDGAQLTLARYPRYVGIDVTESSVAACRERFAGDTTKNFYLAGQMPASLGPFDLVLSLDVIYHLVEDEVFDAYMRSIFASASRFVIIYSSNKNERSEMLHVRHRLFTDWIETHEPQWVKLGFIANKYPWDSARQSETSFADFYFFERR
jgi:SAM-dependent methyltransferase